MIEPVHVALSIVGVLLVLLFRQWVEHRRFKAEVESHLNALLGALSAKYLGDGGLKALGELSSLSGFEFQAERDE